MATAQSTSAPTNAIEPALKPWERIGWTKVQEQAIYRDWACYFMYKQRPNVAAFYYDKALNLKADDPVALYFRSICRRSTAECEAALEDAKMGAELEPFAHRQFQAIADAFYGLNQFENSKIELHNSCRKLHGSIVDEFLHRLDIVDKNLKDSLGDSLSRFFRKNKEHITNVAKEIQLSKIPDKRPYWKKLRDEDKCDVQSLLEQEAEVLSPLELARRKRTFQVFNQIYMNREWKDVIYLHNLQKDRKWFSPRFKESTPYLRNLIRTKYTMVNKFIKMLHCRSPMYNQWIYNSPNEKLQKRLHDQYMNYQQYRTRREMIVALRRVKELAKTGPIVRFAQYVEHITGDMVGERTRRLMPWKFEFLNEVYNIFGIALVDRFKKKIILNSNTEVPRDKLFEALIIDNDPNNRIANFSFGNKTSYLAAQTGQNNFTTYKNFLARLERRMRFAKYSIEKCYLWHGMAAANFLQTRYGVCIELAKKGIKESQQCNGTIWAFLCSMLIVRSYAAMKKVELCKDALYDANEWAKILKDDKVVEFVDSIQTINDIYIDLKKRSQSRDNLRKRKSISRNTVESFEDSKVISGETSEIAVAL